MDCNWCKEKLPNIFAGDEVDLQGEALFVCKECKKLIDELNKRKK